eukprot:TRINITY_DN7616_c0_g1_i4.p1 TRINITY_DN7616_c0_g1~~TRINITY_DN7616_c0_g1_i4.p1  ORF type:complete len:173 (+),score=36.97 TRINITY_DN7616_c0_g1_i4:330-848(+)
MFSCGVLRVDTRNVQVIEARLLLDQDFTVTATSSDGLFTIILTVRPAASDRPQYETTLGIRIDVWSTAETAFLATVEATSRMSIRQPALCRVGNQTPFRLVLREVVLRTAPDQLLEVPLELWPSEEISFACPAQEGTLDIVLDMSPSSEVAAWLEDLPSGLFASQRQSTSEP